MTSLALRSSLQFACAFGLTGAVMVAGACNSISGLDTEYELETDASPTNPVDGGTSSGIPVGDGASGSDAVTNTDGPPQPVDAGPFSCATAPPNLFCSDFENNQAPFGWTQIEQEGADGPKVEDGVGRTGRGLHVKVVGSGASHNNGVSQTITFNPSWEQGQSVTLRFSFKVASAGTYAVMGMFEFVDREHGLSVYPSGQPNDCAVSSSPCVDENDQQMRGHDKANSQPLVANVWHDAVVTLTKIPGNNYSSKVTVDGDVVDTRTSGAMPASAPGSLVVSVGARYSGENGTTELYIDDVLVTRQ